MANLAGDFVNNRELFVGNSVKIRSLNTIFCVKSIRGALFPQPVGFSLDVWLSFLFMGNRPCTGFAG